MGWSSGAELAADVWSVVRPFIPPKKLRATAKKLVDLFESEDADTLYDEAEQLMTDAGLWVYASDVEDGDE